MSKIKCQVCGKKATRVEKDNVYREYYGIEKDGYLNKYDSSFLENETEVYLCEECDSSDVVDGSDASLG